MSEPTIAAGFPKSFLDFAVSRGADRATLIEQSRISSADLEEQDNRVPLASYIRLIEAGIESCREPALALLFGETVLMQDISIVGLLGESADTAHEGLSQLNRYANLVFDNAEDENSSRFELVREGGALWLKASSRLYRDYPLLTESAFARCVCTARSLIGSAAQSPPFLKAVHFTYDEPSYRAEYERIFGVPLVFGSRANALLIDEKLMTAEPPRKNPYAARVLTAHAETLLKNLTSSKSTRGRVESLLIPALPAGEASMDAIARKMGLSRQTLFRRLKAENTTFERVLGELRRKLALHYLNEKKSSVNETAYLLGFSEPSSFSRAFKRWTGSSPRDADLKGRRRPSR